MADEYSDEEFAPDDAEPAYETEFDDVDAQDHDASAAYEQDDDHDVDGALDGSVDANAATNAYQESYDAEFDDDEAAPPDSAWTMAANAADPADLPPPEHNTEAEEKPAPSCATDGGVVPEASTPLESQDSPPRDNSEKADLFPRRSAPLRRSSEPRMQVLVPEIERCVDPELQAKLTRRRSSPRPAPMARLHSVGELTAASFTDQSIPTNEVTEEAAQLTRRASSPRMRPAPIARLPSVGEFSAAAPDELEVPTNAVTDEAASIASGGGGEGVTRGMVKRHSSHTFIPRLPSLRELDGELVAKLEAAGIGTNADGSDGDEKDEEDEDEEENEEDEIEGDDHNEREGEEEVREDDTPVTDGDVNDKMSRNDANHRTPFSSDGETKVLNEGCLEMGKSSNSEDPPSFKSYPPKPAELSPMELAGERGLVGLGRIAHSDTSCDGQQQVEVTPNAYEARGDSQLSERPKSCHSQDGSSARSTPLPLSEHLPDEEAETQDDRLQEVMAMVEVDEVIETGIAEDLDGDTVHAIDGDDDNGRETEQLLQEAQNLIKMQTHDIVDVDLAERRDQNHHVAETERYEGEDQFSDDGYADDEELLDGAYYDSDHDDSIDEDQSSRTASSVLQEQTEGTPQAQSVETLRVSSTAPPGSKTPPITPPTKKSAKNIISVNPTQLSPKKPAVPRQSSLRPSPSKSSTVCVEETNRRPISRGSSRAPVPSTPATPAAPARKPEVPRFTPKAAVPRQQALTPGQSRVTSPSEAETPLKTVNSCRQQQNETNELNPSTKKHQRSSSENSTSPTKSDRRAGRPSSPTRGGVQHRPESPPRKAPVFKQKRPSKPTSTDALKKKLRPVKCPPNLRVELPHIDKEKREWLLLNMFRHGNDIDKYEPFMPTTTPERAIELNLPFDSTKRPLSARHIYGEADQPQHRSSSRGAYGRHGGRRIVDPPVDPRTQARERNWISSTPSVSSIPQYDSILDKYCKTVTSPVVQRRIYETRMDDLSPQLAMVLEKRAFKEWKHSESEGFGAVSTSYKTAIVSTKSPSTASTTTLHTPRPPSSPAPAKQSSSEI